MDVSEHLQKRSSVRFCVKFGKTAAETYIMIIKAYGKSAMSKKQVFRWHKCFTGGTLKICDDPQSGRPIEVMSKKHIDRVNVLIKQE